MSVLFVRSPLRISLGGGGTDLPSYYRTRGGFVLAGAIDKYVYLVTHPSFEGTFRMRYAQFEETDRAEAIDHPILREALVNHWSGPPLEISSVADAPAGTGLGSSGAFTVGVLKSLALARRSSTTPAKLAEDAAEIEIDRLGQPVGKQDPYAAAHGGICSYTFEPDGEVIVEPLALSSETLESLRDHLLLFFTGRTRAAATILSDQASRSEAADAEMLDNLDRIKEMGRRSKQLLEAGDLEGYAHQMHEHWEMKRARSPGIATERVDELYLLARRSGALGGKLVGAGGGGYLLVYTPRPDDARQAMAAAHAPELRFDFEFHGCVGSESQ